MRSFLAALRFGRHWSAPRPDLEEREVEVSAARGAPVPGTLARLPGAGRRRGWVVLHGITRPGRRHPELLRFVRALASTGGRVLVPEVPPWTDLRFEPERAQDIVAGAVRELAVDSGSAPGGVVLMGFSFGGPQALLAASRPEVAPSLRGVVSWGGYGDLDRTVRFQFTGRHRGDDGAEVLRPDPYGRWVVGANCLTLAPGYEDRGAVARALHRLAVESGERRLPALDPGLDPLKATLRAGLPARDRELFDLFAPPWDEDPDEPAGLEVARAMVEAARERVPLLEPIPLIERLDPPVRLLHGRSDRLIPWTETLHLEAALRPRAPRLKTRFTGLFGHSEGAGEGSALVRLRESVHFLRLLASVFELDG